MSFPLIGKPDIGMKGIMVKKLNNENELVNYCENIKVDFLIQNNVSYPEEVGIFYYRYPSEENGHISGIVKKEFLSVKGDGISTINELIKQKPRAILQAKTLEKNFGQKLDEVLKKDEKFILVPYGSHFRGSKFIDDSHLIDPKISAQIDSICKQVNGFYFGRLDIRYSTWDELCEGKNFSIIEINGVGSEPTHMYDPGHSLFFAWSEIIRHWRILYRISKQNHKRLKIPYMTTKEGLDMFRQHRNYTKQLTI